MQSTRNYSISLLWWLIFWGVAASRHTAPPALIRSATLASLGQRHMCAAVEKGPAIPAGHHKIKVRVLERQTQFQQSVLVVSSFSLQASVCPCSCLHSAFLSFMTSGLHDSTATSGSTLQTEAVGCPDSPVGSHISMRTKPYNKFLILYSHSNASYLSESQLRFQQKYQFLKRF